MNRHYPKPAGSEMEGKVQELITSLVIPHLTH